ncbi:MAG: hypothetical protein ACXIUV_07035 [Alkalilacustris sp.]
MTNKIWLTGAVATLAVGITFQEVVAKELQLPYDGRAGIAKDPNNGFAKGPMPWVSVPGPGASRIIMEYGPPFGSKPGGSITISVPSNFGAGGGILDRFFEDMLRIVE